MSIWKCCEQQNYEWEENNIFTEWLIKEGAYICYNIRFNKGKWQGLLDGRGWFAPQWKNIPPEVVKACNPRKIK